MDVLLIVILATIGIGGMIEVARSPSMFFLFRWAAWPALAWLTWYVAIAIGRSRPELWNGDVQIGWITIGFIVIGLGVLIFRTNPKHGGGEFA